ncbi:MAG: UbiD family decarboxylase [Deltaproteobacteria bacterium]|nr:UbiD family decarboxylase [Deltaproteobacteria bacterium]
MPYADMRSFLNRLEKEGEVHKVEAEVNLVYEIGAVCRLAIDRGGVDGNKALYFSNIKGHSQPLTVNLLSTRRRFCLALECDPEDVHNVWIQRTQSPVEPKIVKTGRCKDVVRVGKDVNLFELPIPTWNGRDGGPYITFPCHISKDPETGIRNAGMYRTMIHDEKTMGILAAPYRHIRHHFEKAHAQGKSLPVAVAMGVDPVIYAATVAPFPFGTDELAMAGALRGEPVEMIPCETIPLEVPASAEVVIEGEIPPGVFRDEGPFGEFTGYYGERAPRPVIQVKAITYRKDFIFQESYEGLPHHETCVVSGVSNEAELIRQCPLPGIKKVHFTSGGGGYLHAVVSVKKAYDGYGKMVGLSVLGTTAGRTVKIVTVVDDDIDPNDLNQVDWAVTTRTRVDRDIEILKDLSANVLDPTMTSTEKRGASRTDKMVIDATKPLLEPLQPECRPEPKIMEQVIRNRQKYGID